MSQPLTVERPTRGVPVERKGDNKYRPFCSDRCKPIDPGVWAAEEHAIPGNTLEDDTFFADLPPREH